MTLVASISTHLGRIELHHDEVTDRFETRRWYQSLTDRRLHEVRIRLSLDTAFSWYEMCSKNGTVYADFPTSPQPEAAPERTTA
jgi:hypothetical protein